MAAARRSNVCCTTLSFSFSIQKNFRCEYFSDCRAQARLPPEVNRILFVKNLPFKITSDEIYDIFGKYGAITQIRIGFFFLFFYSLFRKVQISWTLSHRIENR